MNATDIIGLLKTNGLPFAVYRLPDEKKFHLVAQKEIKSLRLQADEDFTSKKGFVFYPFVVSEKFPAIIISPDLQYSFSNFTETISEPLYITKKNIIDNKENVTSWQATDKSDFINHVKIAVNKIKAGEIEKSVLSAVNIYEVADDFDGLKLYEKLCSTYPHVFVYLINTPLTGCWIGATPELLLKFNETLLETVSLAGTQFDAGNNGKTKWGEKEINEQHLVTKHIQQCFENNFSEPLQISETKTISTGHLLHLRTDFKLHSQNGLLKKSVFSFLKNLHPTPAISGIPKEASVQHILRTEIHERAYYTGFLGPVNLHENSQLYVNLRCLKYENHKLIIYTGAGITADSVPEKEWEEVQLKAQTILKVLKDF